jgi:hypothetical protein
MRIRIRNTAADIVFLVNSFDWRQQKDRPRETSWLQNKLLQPSKLLCCSNSWLLSRKLLISSNSIHLLSAIRIL